MLWQRHTSLKQMMFLFFLALLPGIIYIFINTSADNRISVPIPEVTFYTFKAALNVFLTWG